MKFRAYAAIDNILKCSSIVHAEIVFMLELPDLRARDTLCHVFVAYFHLIVKSLSVLGGAAYGERVHLGA